MTTRIPSTELQSSRSESQDTHTHVTLETDAEVKQKKRVLYVNLLESSTSPLVDPKKKPPLGFIVHVHCRQNQRKSGIGFFALFQIVFCFTPCYSTFGTSGETDSRVEDHVQRLVVSDDTKDFQMLLLCNTELLHLQLP